MKPCLHHESVSCDICMHFSSERDALRARELLQSMMARTNAKYDCLECRIDSDEDHLCCIHYIERWSCEAAFITHAGSAEFRRVLNAVDFCSEMPDVKVERIYTDSGLECIQKILEQAAQKLPENSSHA